MSQTKRVFLIVLDSVGAGELPDAADFGDKGAHTLRSVSVSACLEIPHLLEMGLGNVEGLSFLGETAHPIAAHGKAGEASKGKDTTTGHWEIAGLISERAMPTFPEGFPKSLIDEFSARCGRGVLCNLPYSGTKVIADYGEEHLKSGDLIVYTSADSVFQIAAHTDIVPVEELYRYCEIAREMLVGEWGVGRVIARPFDGTHPFHRSPDRKDFSLEPHGQTLLDQLKEQGFDVLSVGKISDIFAARGVTASYPEHGNPDCMAKTEELQKTDFHGLCFINLVDFDMVYGHRNDVDGYAGALSAFDQFLGTFLTQMREDDVLMICADHGCDPGDISTDHTREYVPILVYGPQIQPVSLGVLPTYADFAATIADLLGAKYQGAGNSFRAKLEG
ncbi:MAG: phosphopentomutase [Clostridia bacterium]|nr:phosphopentomutase [Clostridia bacterium]